MRVTFYLLVLLTWILKADAALAIALSSYALVASTNYLLMVLVKGFLDINLFIKTVLLNALDIGIYRECVQELLEK